MSTLDVCATVGCNHRRDEHGFFGCVVLRHGVLDRCGSFTEPPTVAERDVTIQWGVRYGSGTVDVARDEREARQWFGPPRPGRPTLVTRRISRWEAVDG